ncbi:hypothetical protein [Paraburkholderia caribensis]|uniref:hypothetical protein n=1 Tax=Paraburkholderia caribensis TaxID=75105 RepID=UPI00078DFC76|nr:hypothetical protein [Paraburkholderia caribensis]AMV48168.1 hypothetical protein ATN79_46725 [Paraburkholderia caribensis]
MLHTFDSDVDRIAEKLIEAFCLKFEGADAQLNDSLIRWLDYRLRYIDPKPREVVRSIGFDGRVPPEANHAFSNFIRIVETGGDLNPYVTKTVKTNDSSGVKRQLRTDGLWADWNIHHAHLTETPLAAGAEFSDRSEWLLFFIALPTQIGLIDVRSHNEPGIFQAVDLVEKAIQSWPDHFEGYRLKGVAGLTQPPATDANAIKSLRVGGVTSFLEIAGNVYMPPGLGVTTAATSTRVSLERDKVKRLARAAGDFFSFHGELVRSSLEKGKPHPTLTLRVSDRGRLVAYCEAEKRTEGFPPNGRSTARTELEERLLPQWAADRLASHLAATGCPAVKSTH